MTPPIVAAVRRFVDDEVRPVAAALEHADAYPHALVARMRALGLFGALVPAEYGGLGLDVTTYARIIEELCRGWMSLAGVVNSHTMATLIVLHHGTEEQRRRFLPRYASGEARGGLCLTEPHAGSDVQAIRTTARREGDHYVLDGSKMFITNGREGHAFALLALTDPARPAPPPRDVVLHRGEGAPRLPRGQVADQARLQGRGHGRAAVRGVRGTGGEPGRRRRGPRIRSGDERARGRPHQHRGPLRRAWPRPPTRTRWPVPATGPPPPALADLATGVEAARLITYWAAGMKDRRERCDLEAGMAKLFASETAHEVALTALRLHGEAGTLQRHTVERHYRDTPLMIIGEGTNEIQRTLIARQLVERHGERLGALTSREAEPEERRQLVLAVRQFVDKSLVPVAAEHEAAGRYPAAIVHELAELGVLGAVVDPRQGGLGLDLVDDGDDPGGAGARLDDGGGGRGRSPDRRRGRSTASPSPAEREAWLPALARADRLATAVFTGDVEARRHGEGWALTGATGLADNAPRADVVAVTARAADGRPLAGARRARALRASRVGEPEATLGARGLDPCVLTLADARPALVLTADGAAAGTRGFAALAAAAVAVGLAQAAFEAALRYSQQRTHLRQAAVPAPGRPAQAGRHGDRHHGGPPADLSRGGDRGRRVRRRGGGDGAPARRLGGDAAPRWSRCGSTAATATSASSRSSASTATPPACCSSRSTTTRCAPTWPPGWPAADECPRPRPHRRDGERHRLHRVGPLRLARRAPCPDRQRGRPPAAPSSVPATAAPPPGRPRSPPSRSWPARPRPP